MTEEQFLSAEQLQNHEDLMRECAVALWELRGFSGCYYRIRYEKGVYFVDEAYKVNAYDEYEFGEKLTAQNLKELLSEIKSEISRYENNSASN